MVYVVYLFERKLSRGNYTLPGKMEAEKIFEVQRAIAA